MTSTTGRASRCAATGAVVALGLLVACTGPSGPVEGPAVGAEGATPSQTTTAGPSPDGVIAFGTEGQGQVVVTRPDGTGQVELAAGTACCAALTPDGERIVFLTMTSDGRETAATMTTGGDDRTVIEPPDGLNLVPGAWARDGSLVYLAGFSDIAGSNGLYAVEPDGTSLERLTRPAGSRFDLPLEVSPDGTLVLFMRTATPHVDPFQGDLYVVPTAGGAAVRLNPKGTVVPWSLVRPGNFFPDSERVAFAALLADTEPARGVVMVATADGSSVDRVRMAEDDGGNGEVWSTTAHVSPDGSWIVFDKWPGWGTVDDGGPNPRQGHALYLVRPDGTGLHHVGEDRENACCAVWSPDGTRLLYSAGGDQANNLVWIAADGSDEGAITHAGGEVFRDYSWAGGGGG